ncbi:hypothetical protein CEP48_00500 [Mergibacter septicus]|uniref:Uncharacterized protein n=1 Tax=Mergibacter septicus TaxID=221402 RepID=A0A8E3MFP3_9PAST|nr:DNA/RNA non-specific endonuclease [Mergibacter septicus]AWX14758.1 hypothetical protein CEP47_00500 [Mergibacter septicus]QDJ14009.1 hypothetical protein CEP48_00500 [Mergibacter septicus]UTU48542.1 DNA/RNA non-specific endonuclease [Mergibacter septicus]WMR95829.1 DNA/RNA non-specific endonuclease [Mergibacter septicus]
MYQKILIVVGLLVGVLGGVEYFKPNIPDEYRKSYQNFLKKLPQEVTTYSQDLLARYFPDYFHQQTQSNRKKETHRLDVTTFKPKGHNLAYCKNNIYQQQPLINSAFEQGRAGKNEITTLCYYGYALQYKDEFKIPLWTAEKLTRQRIEQGKNGNRPPHFYSDPNLEKKFNSVITHEDYTGSGYDRGHVAPSRDMPLADRLESFYMSNIVPQTAQNNRFIWANIEQISRCMATKYNTDVYVVNVPVIDVEKAKRTKKLKILQTKTGKQIVIPDYMAKAIYIPKRNEIGVYLTQNNTSKTKYKLVSINQLKKLAYIDVFPTLPSSLKNKISKLPNPNNVDTFCG